MTASYEDFIAAKRVEAPEQGFEPPLPISEVLFPFQRDIVRWACRRGRAAIFASFGLGKTLVQLEIARQCAVQTCGRVLIVLPLGVRQEFRRDAGRLGLVVRFIRRVDECDAETSVYLTNYETVRDGKIDPREFDTVLLDEAAVLRGFGGSKTFRELMATCAGDDRRDMAAPVRGASVRYRFVATATPAPNEYQELLAYSAFLDVMDVSAAKTRFFKRDSEKADNLTLHAHKEREWWHWIATWAVFITRPSDIDPTYSDAGYQLPELRVHWHELASSHADAGEERDGQRRLVKDSAIGVTEASREKRASMAVRVARVMEVIGAVESDQPVIWCDLNDEQTAIERALRAADITCSSLTGSTDPDEREVMLEQWRDRDTRALVSKASMYGAGVNLQQSHSMVFSGIGFKARTAPGRPPHPPLFASTSATRT
jgi:hypothetical protein